MRKLIVLATLAVAGSALADYTPGNLVVSVRGDGDTPISGVSVPVRIREFTTAGTQVGGDVPLPIAQSGPQRALTVAPEETSEAMLNWSVDGRYLLIVGYNVPPGTDQAAFFADRTVGRIARDFTVNTITGIPFSEIGGDSTRTAYSLDGSQYWVAHGSAGITYQAHGTTSGVTQIVPSWSSCRYLTSFNGDFYYSSSDDNALDNTLYKVEGMPTGAADPVVELDLTPSARGFVFLNENTLYMASSTGSAGVIKYERLGGIWVEAYRSGSITGGVNGIVYLNGKFYLTTSSATNSRLLEVVDTGTTFTSTILATAETNYAFRGIAVVPDADAIEVLADSYAVTRGVEIGENNVTKLHSDDDVRAVVEQRTQFSPAIPNAELQAVLNISGGTPSGADVVVRILANSLPLDHPTCRQEIALRNWSTGSFVVVDSRKPTGTESEIVLSLTSEQIANFVRGDGRVEVATRVFHGAPLSPAWRMQVDQLILRVTR